MILYIEFMEFIEYSSKSFSQNKMKFKDEGSKILRT